MSSDEHDGAGVEDEQLLQVLMEQQAEDESVKFYRITMPYEIVKESEADGESIQAE
jgi:hypothetical protein